MPWRIWARSTTHAYDAAGNRTDMVVNGVLDTHYDCDAANQVLCSVYDVAGNVISDTVRGYTYDALGATDEPERRP
jgi:hypothetical protein